MYTEVRKIGLLEKVLKVSDEATLIELEKVLGKSRMKKKKQSFSAHDFLGVISKKDAALISKAIEESCEQIHPDDWKQIFIRTNIIVAWLNGETSIANKIDSAREIYIPIIVLGELYYGAMNSIQVNKNINEIQKAISHYTVLLIDEGTTINYGNIKTALRKKGKPIPENDIWISSIAQRYKLAIITRDKHFKEIEDLNIVKW